MNPAPFTDNPVCEPFPTDDALLPGHDATLHLAGEAHRQRMSGDRPEGFHGNWRNALN
jgi:hypothetical protein